MAAYLCPVNHPFQIMQDVIDVRKNLENRLETEPPQYDGTTIKLDKIYRLLRHVLYMRRMDTAAITIRK